MRSLALVLACGALLPLASAFAKRVAPHARVVALPVGADAFLARNAKLRGVVQTPSGLQYRVLKAATGAHPSDSDVALVTYVGKLTNGTVFDQSARPTPMPVSGVVPGFAEALKLMPKGATYRVWIKPSLGYGDEATGPIPAGSVLVFDIALLDIMPAVAYREMLERSQEFARPPQ